MNLKTMINDFLWEYENALLARRAFAVMNEYGRDRVKRVNGADDCKGDVTSRWIKYA
jgi:hypothetical protein